jgi:hypothetical protein
MPVLGSTGTICLGVRRSTVPPSDALEPSQQADLKRASRAKSFVEKPGNLEKARKLTHSRLLATVFCVFVSSAEL